MHYINRSMLSVSFSLHQPSCTSKCKLSQMVGVLLLVLNTKLGHKAQYSVNTTKILYDYNPENGNDI